MVESGFIPNNIFGHVFLLKHLSYSQFKCLSVTCGRLVVFSTNKTDPTIITDRHNNNWNIVESGAKHYKPSN